MVMFLPSGNSFSLDRYLAISKIKDQKNIIPKEIGQVWALNLIRLIAVVYFFAAIDKSYLDLMKDLNKYSRVLISDLTYLGKVYDLLFY